MVTGHGPRQLHARSGDDAPALATTNHTPAAIVTTRTPPLVARVAFNTHALAAYGALRSRRQSNGPQRSLLLLLPAAVLPMQPRRAAALPSRSGGGGGSSSPAVVRRLLERGGDDDDDAPGFPRPAAADRERAEAAAAGSMTAGALMGIVLLTAGGCGLLLVLVWRVGEWLVARQRRRAGYVEMQDSSAFFSRPWADAGE